MSDTNKTSADIIAEMRCGPYSWSVPSEIPGVEKCNYESCKIANRLEAALKREKAATEADALAVGGIVEAERHKPGDAAAIREALIIVRKVAAEMKCGYASKEAYDRMIVDGWATRLTDIADAALAKPPRNCDVGTAEEQVERHYKNYCRIYHQTPECKPNIDSCAFCFARWSQKPYMEGEAK